MTAVYDGFGGLGEIGTDGADEAVFTAEVRVFQYPVLRVTGDQDAKVFQQ